MEQLESDKTAALADIIGGKPHQHGHNNWWNKDMVEYSDTISLFHQFFGNHALCWNISIFVCERSKGVPGQPWWRLLVLLQSL